ncbi:dTDP-4-dehydrorhamnose 3,5-epimerase family protein [Ottowia sp. VDI28]|uniref:dTDP-4-dehydrorhamnose 3,5-epimerase family protein n=1 Tax=Ottowia sp. VDI28 TaxID=3133968 RepID=UPI003C2FF22C
MMKTSTGTLWRSALSTARLISGPWSKVGITTVARMFVIKCILLSGRSVSLSSSMPVHRTAIEGLLVLTWDTVNDERGYFKHTYQHGELAQALGREPRLRQGNHSRSRTRVLRGFTSSPGTS